MRANFSSDLGQNHYVIRVLSDPSQIDASAWDGLLDAQAYPSPFLRHAYLAALFNSGSAIAATGWQMQFVLIERDKGTGGTGSATLVAACPLYLKSHSYGEYVFDWAWADAYQRHGLEYYPKLLSAVPFTPVPGPRLMARSMDDRVLLLRALRTLAGQEGLSSVHLLFLDEAGGAAAKAAGWMLRTTVQFHWHNRAPMPYADFADFLASLQREKRKKVAQERRRVADAGVSFTVAEGGEISEADWDYFYRCYALTYAAHHSTPYLRRTFFSELARSQPAMWLLFTAWQGGERIASSLIAIDRTRGCAYGRYWGCTVQLPCLHFEACYYQPLSWCIANGFGRFEGGAQGEHKMARGLLPVQTTSAHWLAHPQFASAVADYLERETQGLSAYLDELADRQPFKILPIAGS